ncbi:MAG: methionyl-tRNA formyltransferase [Betaproteobacteria bacterium]|jgi:methionyl-tRNA formyltransferase|nr:methionyl-tRNA formyltransferase [Betaproteobacteria bacterium]
MRTAASAVKRLAISRGLALTQPERLGAAEADALRAVRADVLVVAAYGMLLPAPFLDLAPHGALNIHASLLPRWRGAAPIQRAILAGDRETGISIMRMDAGLDTGPVLSRHRLPIGDDDDAGTLHDKLASLGGKAIVEALAQLEAGNAKALAQSAEGATYARKIGRDDALLNWSQAAALLERVVRALRPSPGAATTFEGERLKVWRARVADGRGSPGNVLAADDALVVACGEGALAITELQRAGGKPLPAREFLRGRVLSPGTRLE